MPLRASPDGCMRQLPNQLPAPPTCFTTALRCPGPSARTGVPAGSHPQPSHCGCLLPGRVAALQDALEALQPQLVKLLISMRQPQHSLPPARSPNPDDNAYAGLKHHFLAGYRSQVKSTCSILSVLAALHSIPRQFLTSMPWFACPLPPATKSCRPAAGSRTAPSAWYERLLPQAPSRFTN